MGDILIGLLITPVVSRAPLTSPDHRLFRLRVVSELYVLEVEDFLGRLGVQICRWSEDKPKEVGPEAVSARLGRKS